MKFIRRFLLLIFIFLILCFPAFAGQPRNYILDNGLRLIVKETPGLGLVAVSVFIDASSLNETTSYNSAIASMVGSMLNKGTGKRTAEALAEELENVGASLGVQNGTDYTEVSYLSLSKDLELGMDMISDILNNAAFPGDELIKQKNDAVAGIKQIEDYPNILVYDELLWLLYGNHPYGIKAKRKIPNIKRFSRANLIKFYNNYYVPSNMIISIVGDISQEDAYNLCEKYFSNMNRGVSNIKIVRKPRTLLKNRYKTVKKKDLKANWLEIGYLGRSIDNPDYPALKVLSNVLGSGMSSRLFQEIREKHGLVYSIGSYYPSRKQKSNFVIYAVCSQQNLSKVKKMIFAEIEKIKSKKVTDDELKRAQNYINGKFIIDHQGLSRKAWYLGWFETLGVGYEMDQNFKNQINAVTADDVLRVAKKYLNKHCTVILGPR